MANKQQLQKKNTKDLLMNINKNLNKEYPKFLKAIPKLSNKAIMKHKLMKLLEEQNIELKESLVEQEMLKDELVTRNDELNKKNSFLDNLNRQIIEFKTAYEIIFNSSKESILLLDTFTKEIVNVNKQFLI